VGYRAGKVDGSVGRNSDMVRPGVGVEYGHSGDLPFLFATTTGRVKRVDDRNTDEIAFVVAFFASKAGHLKLLGEKSCGERTLFCSICETKSSKKKPKDQPTKSILLERNIHGEMHCVDSKNNHTTNTTSMKASTRKNAVSNGLVVR
jgi:hypothetical protein